MKRAVYSERHDWLRAEFREFVTAHVVPHQMRWMEAGIVDREVWQRAGSAGFLCRWLPSELGGRDGDFLDACVISEELAAVYESGFWPNFHSDLVAPYLYDFGNEEQRRRWLPGCARGDLITAIAMTEPECGSDLGNLSTTATRDGDVYVLRGVKKYVSNGMLFDLCVVAARTPPEPDLPQGGISLFVVEGDTPGLHRRPLKKIGMLSQDTAELTIDECRVPSTNRLGAEGAGLMMLMKQFPRERILVAIMAQALAEQALKDTLSYVKRRIAYGQPIAKLQNTQFELAACAAQVEVGRAFIDKLVVEHARNEPLTMECSIAKLWLSEMLGDVLDRCMQLFGASGYMFDNPIARAYVDARVKRIGAGTSEVLKVLIARQLGL